VKIAVAGGTGVVGRYVTGDLRAAGHDPVILARSAGTDLTTGDGLAAALAGADAVIDVSNVLTSGKRRSVAFFETATQHLLAAGQEAGVRHHLALSVVGCDRVALGYYVGKKRQEELVLGGPVPATVLRATQFHEFPAQLLDRGSFVSPVPVMRSQPVAAREVAAELVRLVAEPPAGLAPELAGPEVLDMVDLVRQVARSRGQHPWILPIRLPGAVGRGLADGGLRPRGDGPRGTETFAQWLARDPLARPPGER
jgi:uncharacterized protein YbjT (DUF2867 family)